MLQNLVEKENSAGYLVHPVKTKPRSSRKPILNFTSEPLMTPGNVSMKLKSYTRELIQFHDDKCYMN